MDGQAAEVQEQFLSLWKISGTLNLQEKNSEVNTQLLAEKPLLFHEENLPTSSSSPTCAVSPSPPYSFQVICSY